MKIELTMDDGSQVALCIGPPNDELTGTWLYAVDKEGNALPLALFTEESAAEAAEILLTRSHKAALSAGRRAEAED